MQLIENTTELDKICQELKNEKFICVDFEFLRERTYFAKLCLIQVASPIRQIIIDPLAKNLDLTAFWQLMQNPQVIKVFHSCRQDIEIAYHLSNAIPYPLFDSQVAAMALGFGEAISYENLVAHVLHLKLDKSNRLSDWSKRPLSDSQLQYAIGDVTHLVHIYEFLSEQLDILHRKDWIAEEMAVLTNPQTYAVNPDEVWQKIKHRSHNARFLTYLKELAAWRELRAQKKNCPRQSFIKDEMLLLICTANPQTKDELAQIRSMRKDTASGKLGDEILEVLQKCRQIPLTDYVTPPKIKSLPDKSSALFELLKLLLKIVGGQQKVVARLIATDEDLHRFSSFKDDNNPILQGWRLDVFGRWAKALRDGDLSISYNPKSQQIEFKHHHPQAD